MSWYERVANDPKGSLERLAESQSLTVEQLQSRHRQIAKILGSDSGSPHLNASDWRIFSNCPEKLSEPLISHLDACSFCKEIGDALSESAIDSRAVNVVENTRYLWTEDENKAEFSFLKYFRKPASVGALAFALMGIVTIGLVDGTNKSVDPVPVSAIASSSDNRAVFLSDYASSLEIASEGEERTARREPSDVGLPIDPVLVSLVDRTSENEEEIAEAVRVLHRLKGKRVKEGLIKSLVCAPSTWKVSSVSSGSMYLTLEEQPNKEISTKCKLDGSTGTMVLTKTSLKGKSSLPLFSVGSSAVVMSYSSGIAAE